MLLPQVLFIQNDFHFCSTHSAQTLAEKCLATSSNTSFSTICVVCQDAVKQKTVETASLYKSCILTQTHRGDNYLFQEFAHDLVCFVAVVVIVELSTLLHVRSRRTPKDTSFCSPSFSFKVLLFQVCTATLMATFGLDLCLPFSGFYHHLQSNTHQTLFPLYLHKYTLFSFESNSGLSSFSLSTLSSIFYIFCTFFLPTPFIPVSTQPVHSDPSLSRQPFTVSVTQATLKLPAIFWAQSETKVSSLFTTAPSHLLSLHISFSVTITYFCFY